MAEDMMNEDDIVVVMTDEAGNEYYYREEMIIPVEDEKYALLVGIHDEDEEHAHTCGCGCEDDDEDVIIAKIVTNVLALPNQLAAMMIPSLLATIRRPETMNSRATMISAIHEGSVPSSQKASSAAQTSILSASGSRNFPKVVTSLRERAR